MLLPEEAFVHVPELLGMITPPETSRFRMTHAAIDAWDQRARELGLPANWRRSHLCRCRACQRFTGTAFASGMVFSASDVDVQGELATFDVVGTSGNLVHRMFCPRYASGVVVRGDLRRDLMVLQVGTLNDPTLYRPTAEIYTDTALPWVHAADGFPTGARP